MRTYCLFKSIFETEPNCTHIMPLRHRAAFAKFRCGVAPLRIETGRYENKPLEERKCPFCDDIESEIHVIFNCNLYDDFRAELFSKAVIVNPDLVFPLHRPHGTYTTMHNRRCRGHAIWTSVSATCSLPLTVPLLRWCMCRVAEERE